ncbi:DUF5642 family protein [Mycobacterium botniense]|uniref:DUF5642 family protein n=1 Tax=Mycobacterium botniense TaxID=84962 RepID=UPI0014790260
MVNRSGAVVIGAAVAVLVVACASSPIPKTLPTSLPSRVNPANIRRVGADLPRGYEVTKITGISAPSGIWGLGAGPTAQPAQCGVLADPVHGRSDSAQGVSGSGADGTVYAVVAAAPSGPLVLDRNLVGQCAQWTMRGGNAKANVRLIDPPHIDGAETLGMATDTTTSVEGGIQIISHTYTFSAYLGDYYAFTALVTEPGSLHAPLTPRFAADLLVKTVSVLRS